MAAKRYRLKYEFWLEPDKSDHEKVADQIEILKNERSFASVVRDGIMIVSELRQGRLGALLDQFPWVKDEIVKQFALQAPVTDDVDLKRELAELKCLINNSSASLRPLSTGPDLTLPRTTNDALFEDEDDMIVITKSHSTEKSARNFLSSAFDLVQ